MWFFFVIELSNLYSKFIKRGTAFLKIVTSLFLKARAIEKSLEVYSEPVGGSARAMGLAQRLTWEPGPAAF